MSDSLATKQDFKELEAGIDVRFERVDARFEFLERHIDTRFSEQERRFEIHLADLEKRLDRDMCTRTDLAHLERRITLRLGGMIVAGIGVFSVLVKVL